MKCIICNSKSKFFLSKNFEKTPYGIDISIVNYYKCLNCGFTLSKTHVEMDKRQWMSLNNAHHHYVENIKYTQKTTNPPPYIDQANMLVLLHKNNIVDINRTLDFGGGYGTLSKILKKYFNLSLSVYDPYVQETEQVKYIQKEELNKYDLVVSSASFEHLYSRASFDEINSLVSKNGYLLIHTVVRENIPKDENWFYMQPPVHCAFHTNASMSILMKQWNYEASIYCPSAKSWILIKTTALKIKNAIKLINSELQATYFIYKDGFVDYWD